MINTRIKSQLDRILLHRTMRWSSISEAMGGVPPATLAVMVVCVGIFVIQNALSWDLQLFTMCPRLILYTHEYYRVFTSALFHANLMHIGMNMLSTTAISSTLENKMGTIRLFGTIWWAIILTSTVYLSITYFAYLVFGYDAWMYQHAVGFSGVIFHLSVLESNLQPGPRSVFGFFSVPSSLYPWVLLVVLQVIMPNLSFLGHLAGILTGTLQFHGLLDGLLLGETLLMDVEAMEIFRPLTLIRGFVATTHGPAGGGVGQAIGHPSSSLSSLVCRTLRNTCGLILKCVRDTLETLVVCIFGRGYSLNMNIRFGPRSPSTSDWFGRPAIQPPDDYRDDGLFLLDNMEEDRDAEMRDQQQGWINQATIASIECEPLASRMV